MNTADFAINVAILAIGRFLDLLSTWYSTPNFEIELNSWMKKVGWRNTIFINMAIVLLVARASRTSVIVFAALSVIIAARNFQAGTMARAMGEQQYLVTYRKFVRTTPWYFNMLPIFCESAIYQTIGITLRQLVGRNTEGNLGYVDSIGQAFFLFGTILLCATIGQRIEKNLKQNKQV